MMNEMRKARRFERGLRPNIYYKVTLFTLPVYQVVLEKAQLIEALYKEQDESSRASMPNKRPLPMPSQQDRKQKAVQLAPPRLQLQR